VCPSPSPSHFPVKHIPGVGHFHSTLSPGRAFAQPKKSDDSSKVTSLENVMDAITSLSLKVDNIEMQHKSLTQLAFEDDNTQKSVVAMRQAENVLQLTKATQLIELFYAEKSQYKPIFFVQQSST
jgi:hypothetical protein